MRAVWKGPFVDNKVLNDIYLSYKTSNNKKPGSSGLGKVMDEAVDSL